MEENESQSGIPLNKTYTPEDLEGFDYREKLNDPGSFPYTRGIRYDLYPGGVWLARELSGEGDPERTNQQFKYLIEKGSLGLDVIGDTPTMAGLDPDHPFARYAIGTQGVSLCCLDDYRTIYSGLPIDRLTLSHSLPPHIVLACLYTHAREQGFDPGRLRGSVIQAPFFTEDCGYTVHMPFKLRLRLGADSVEFCAREMPKFHSFVEDTYFISEAGLDSVEEMALGFIEIRYLIRELLRRGVDIDSFGPRIAILLNGRMDFFEEIAKVRATRRLFAKMMRDEFGAKDERSQRVVITCHTSGLTLTAQQPFNNITRGTIEALAMVLAGVQAIEISAFDEAYRTPSPESHMVGLRAQQVIHMETNVTKVVDPLAGSYYVESLTDELEKRIWDMVQHIEGMGDASELSDGGWFKRNFFDNAMQRHHKKLQDQELLKVGVNVMQIPEEEDTILKDVAERKIEPCLERVDWIKEYKERRDPAPLEEAVRELHRKAGTEGENLVYAVIDAMEVGATMGEIAGILRMAYGADYDPFGMEECPFEL
ncbi:MAG: methylmalonyl-CoA mutase family protein [Actinomycetota bacterium]